MKLLTKLSAVVVFLLCSVSIQEMKASGEFCPDGCDCEWVPAPWRSWVDCFQVADCDAVYPDFCDDFRSACATHCGGDEQIASYSCWGGAGSCYGDCTCLLPG